MSPYPAAPPPPGEAPERSRRRVWLGVAVGAVLPLVAFLLVLLEVAPWWFGQVVWSGVAFVGVAFQFSPRTKQLGAGMLLGFLVLVVAGAGTCTAAVMALA